MSETHGRQYETAQMEHHGKPLRTLGSPALELAEAFRPVLAKVVLDIHAAHVQIGDAVDRAVAEHLRRVSEKHG